MTAQLCRQAGTVALSSELESDTLSQAKAVNSLRPATSAPTIIHIEVKALDEGVERIPVHHF